MDTEEYEELLAEHDPSVEDETREETDRLAEEAINADPEDPNEDLIGFKFQALIKTWTETKEWTVVGSASWSSNYVEIVSEDGDKTVRPAGLVRQAMQRA